MKHCYRFYIYLASACWGSFLTCTLVAEQQNNLHKIAYQNNTDIEHIKQEMHLERGHVILYFSREPSLKIISNKLEKNMQHKVLFFPDVTLTIPQSEHIIAQQMGGNLVYKIVLEQVTKPEKGVKCTISYDDSSIIMEYELFTPIKMKSGLMIRFYDKRLVHALQQKSNSLLQVAQNNNRSPKVVIDCGHGGHDPGAFGIGGITEKDIVLNVGLDISNILRQKGIAVLLTRDHDCFVSLDERIAQANKSYADLLVSIHVDASLNSKAQGMTLFCLHTSLFKLLDSTASINEKKAIKKIKKISDEKNRLLAEIIHRNMLLSIRQEYSSYHDRFIRNAAPQLLLGVKMPAILIELGFISNPQESKILSSKIFQKNAANAIAHGIIDYFAHCYAYNQSLVKSAF